MKVHVNVAKEMLFEYHKQQKTKKPDSVHAIYIVAGTRKNVEPAVNGKPAGNDGEDVIMESSPFPSSLTQGLNEGADDPPPEVLSITLVREEDLEGMKERKAFHLSRH